MRSCLWIQDLRDEGDISFCLASLHFSRWQSLISLENELPIDGPVGSLSYRDTCLPHRGQGTLADQSRHWLENLNPELSGSWMLLRLNPSQDITESFPVRPLQLAPFLCLVLGMSLIHFSSAQNWLNWSSLWRETSMDTLSPCGVAAAHAKYQKLKCHC